MADEEKEHASMVLEWIRRKDPSFDKGFSLGTHLLRHTPINTAYLNCPPKAGVTGSNPVGRAN